MNAEKAKEIVKNALRSPLENGELLPYQPEVYEAEGYLAALKGQEVKALVEATKELVEALEKDVKKNIHDSTCGVFCCSDDTCTCSLVRKKEILSRFKSDKGGKN